jgi:signal transduction histidine kinase
MGGIDITSDAVTNQNGKYTVSIGSVTGNIVIEATASSGVVAIRSNEDIADAVTIKYKIGDTTNSQIMSLKADGVARIYGIGFITSITFTNTAKELSTVEVEQLFDRFYTVEVARNSTGLGLSIARTLVERMGVTITADYDNGRLTIRIML